MRGSGWREREREEEDGAKLCLYLECDDYLLINERFTLNLNVLFFNNK